MRLGGHVVIGAVLGILILHPVTMAIYWFEFHPETGDGTFWRFALRRAESALGFPMLAMSGVFAALGAAVGLGAGVLYGALGRRDRALSRLRRELEWDIESLIRCGETERVEFKSSMRWDYRQQRVNRALEMAVVKTIAGFLNGAGGNLILGVADDHSVLGLEKDYRTLRRPDRDGFEACLMGLLHQRLGGDRCTLVHLLFHRIGDRDVCRVLVEPGESPTYVQDGGVSKYYLRVGNATRDLDVRDAIRHIARRWG